ncbi:MAG: GAF domain-containing sensor histidine kinase [Chloroflexi bacterium]|nr:GAF domain-containing sensor histidine kinase [Chloroflexota bacterium]
MGQGPENCAPVGPFHAGGMLRGTLAGVSDMPAPGDRSVLLPPALQALDAAVRGISGVLDVEQVLQLIVGRVRELVAAEYAALGIVDEEAQITEFITSGISADQRRAIGDLPRGRGLLGLIIRENRSYRIAHIASHPESYGFPPNHPPMDSFLGVPVTVKGGVVGRLYLTNKQDAPEFSADDQALVETFALHAGIAIENARLHEQVQRLAVVDERDRISRDLHDSVIQSIYAVTLSLDDVPELVGEAPEEARQRVDDAIDALHGVIRDIRNFIFGLRPLLVDAGSLLDGLRALAEELRRNTTTEVEVVGEEVDGLSVEVVAELLSITREALANIARHSGAKNASIRLTMPHRMIRLEIADDGRGLDPNVAIGRGHHGLDNIRARAEALRGDLDIQSGVDAGARIIVTLPHAGSKRGASE